MARKRIIYAAALLFLTAVTAQNARAEELELSVIDYAGAGLYAAGLALVYFGTDPPSMELWRGTSFDNPLRENVRIESETGRTAAARASDVLQAALIAFPILVDAALVKGTIDGKPEDALRLILIDAEAFFLSGLIVTALKNLTGRRRPDDRGNHAFPSGHTAVAFTGAGLMCGQHSALRLFGNPTADDAACALGLIAATTTGLLRVASDRHWVTDALAGAAIGILSGYLMPSLMHDLTITPVNGGATIGIRGEF